MKLCEVQTQDQFSLPLARLPGAGARGSVLLIHGASAGSNTFLTPRGAGLADHLQSAGYDVWMVDWRGGRNVTESHAARRPSERFTLDAAAEHDLAPCLEHIARTLGSERRTQPLSIVAHCVGAGMLAMAIARHDLAKRHGISNIVLLTLGLFYEQPVSGVLKAPRTASVVRGEGCREGSGRSGRGAAQGEREGPDATPRSGDRFQRRADAGASINNACPR